MDLEALDLVVDSEVLDQEMDLAGLDLKRRNKIHFNLDLANMEVLGLQIILLEIAKSKIIHLNKKTI